MIQPLPIPQGPGYLLQVTDTSLAIAGRIAVRMYGCVYGFRRSTEGLIPDPARPGCDIRGLDPQGEGRAWGAGGHLLLTSEPVGPVGRTTHLVRCPGA